MFSVELTTYICLYDIILNGFYREAFKMERAILCLLNVVSLLGKPQNDDSQLLCWKGFLFICISQKHVEDNMYSPTSR